MSLAMPDQLDWVGLATPPREKHLQPPTKLEAEVGVGAIGVGETLAMAPIQVCWGGPTVQTSRGPRHQRGLPTGMTDAGESLREPCVLRGAGGPLSPTSDFGDADGAADVAPARWTAPGVILRRILRVGSWNVLSLSEDHRLPHLSDELSRLRVDMVGLSQTRSPIVRVLLTTTTV